MKEIFDNIFKEGNKIYTKNLAPGRKVYTERFVSVDGLEYREWDRTKSKLSAAITNGIKEVPIKKGTKVLYLGASTGTTVSHVSDIIESHGIVYAVEFAKRVLKNIFSVASARNNIVPILADARKPGDYYWVENVDVVYCDVAQPDQTRIAIDNTKYFGAHYIMIAIKSQSIDVTKNPDDVYKEQIDILEKNGFEVVDWVKLDPYEKDHCFIVAKRL